MPEASKLKMSPVPPRLEAGDTRSLDCSYLSLSRKLHQGRDWNLLSTSEWKLNRSAYSASTPKGFGTPRWWGSVVFHSQGPFCSGALKNISFCGPWISFLELMTQSLTASGVGGCWLSRTLALFSTIEQNKVLSLSQTVSYPRRDLHAVDSHQGAGGSAVHTCLQAGLQKGRFCESSPELGWDFLVL